MNARKSFLWIGMPVVVVCCLKIGMARAQEYNIGDHVLVIRKAPVGVEGQDEKGEVVPGLILKVENVNNQWLWVTHEKPGWLNRANVTAINREAIFRLTQMIAANQEDDVLRRARGLIRGRFGQFDGAISDLNEAIRLKPSAETYNGRGRIYSENGKLPEAIADFTESLKLDPDNADVLNNRAHALLFSDQYDKALKDFNKTIELKPKYSFAYMGRGLTWRGKGEYAKALKDYDQAQQLDPDYPAPYKYRALLRASCPNEKLRDGKLAVQDATIGCEKTQYRDPSYLDALAAANAELGDFSQAVRWQARATERAPQSRQADYEKRLNLYRDKKPYREEKK